MSDKAKGILLAVTAAAMWGIMGVFVRQLTAAGYSSFDITFIRCFLAGLTFLIFTAMTNREALKIDIKGLLISFLYGAVAYSLSFISYNVSVSRIPVAVATVLMFMSPIWVIILGKLIFKEQVQKRKIIAIAICIVGAVMVSNLISATGGKLDFLGIIAGIINGFGVALQIMIPRYFADRYRKDTMLIYGFLGGALILSLFADFSLIGSTVIASGGKILVHIVGIGILCTLIANVAYVKSTSYINTDTASIFSALEVVVGSVVGFLIFHETLTITQICGAIIIVLGTLSSELDFAKKN